MVKRCALFALVACTSALLAAPIVISRSHYFDVTFPDEISGLVLWLDAADASSVGSTGVWADKTAQNNDTSQGTAGYRPTYSATAVNGQPGVDFDGTDDYLIITDDASLQTDTRTIFVVALRDTTSSHDGIMGQLNTGDICFYWQATSGGTAGEFYSSSGGTTYSTTATLSSGSFTAAVRLYTLKFDSSNWTLYVDGSQVDTGAHTTLYDSTDDLALGALRDTGANPFDGKIAEVVWYNTALADDDREGIEAYLNDKYSIY